MSAARKLPDVEARARLAEAIEAHTACVERIAGIERAKEDLFEQRCAARRALEAVAEAAENASRTAANGLIDRALGKPMGAQEPIADAQTAIWTKEDLDARIDQLLAADNALTKERELAERDLRWSTSKLRDAVGKVLCESAEVQKLLASFEQKRRELAAMRCALAFLDRRGAVPNFWDTQRVEAEDRSIATVWESAVRELERHADAQLPK